MLGVSLLFGVTIIAEAAYTAYIHNGSTYAIINIINLAQRELEEEPPCVALGQNRLFGCALNFTSSANTKVLLYCATQPRKASPLEALGKYTSNREDDPVNILSRHYRVEVGRPLVTPPTNQRKEHSGDPLAPPTSPMRHGNLSL